MKHIDIGCKVNCWECTRACEKKGIIAISVAVCEVPGLSVVASYKGNLIQINQSNAEDFFNTYILDYLKPIAGQLIAQGKNPEEIQQDVKELAVAFYVVRLKMIELSRS